MARHKHKNPRVKVFFRYRGRCFRLLEAINFGTKTAPELKIKGLAETYMQTKDDQHRFDGHFHVGQLIRFIDGKNVEFTYHKDGSILSEVVMSPGHKEYFNPYGKNEKWTPLSEIDSYQPVMVLQILSLADYRPAFIENKYGLKNYIVKNERLFEFQRGQGMMVLIYLKHKDFPLAKYCFDDMNYSDVLMKFGENLELCIFIQKQLTPDNAGSLRNNFTFVDRLDGYDYMSNILLKHIFDKNFAGFMDVVQKGDRYFDISEKMMQVIESVDPLYNLWEGNNENLSDSPFVVRYQDAVYQNINSIRTKEDEELAEFMNNQPEWNDPEFLAYIKDVIKRANGGRVMGVWEIAKYRLMKKIPVSLPIEKKKELLLNSEAWNGWVNQHNSHLNPEEINESNIQSEINTVGIRWGMDMMKRYQRLEWLPIAMNSGMCDIYIPKKNLSEEDTQS